MWKIMLLTAGIAALLTGSATAQSYQPEWGSGNIVPNTNEPYVTPNGPFFAGEPYDGSVRSRAGNSYAYQPAPRHHLRYHTMQGHSDMDRM